MNTRIHAFTVQFIKRMSDNWQTSTSFSYTDTFGILPSGRGSTTGGQSTALVFSSFGQNPNDFVNMEGQLNGQRPWMFKSQFLYQFPQDFLLALNYTLQAGKAYARRVRVPETGLSTEINAETRDGSRQGDDWNLLDVRLQKLFAIGPQARVGVFFDFLNLFNAGTNESVESRLGTSSGFGVRSVFLPPRRLQLGVEFQF